MDDLEKLLQEGSADEEKVTTAEKEEKSMAVRQEVRKATNGGVAKFAQLKKDLYGKLVVVYGAPFAGKTTFAMRLAREFKNAILYKVDKNYNAKDFGFTRIVHEIYSPKQLLYLIDQVREVPDDCITIVDSITSLDSFFVGEDPVKDDPRVNNRRARFCDAVMLRLQKFKKKGCVIVIAHEAIKDFKTGEVGPRMNKVAMRHCDVLIHIVVEGGRRKLKKTIVRRPVVEPEFDIL